MTRFDTVLVANRGEIAVRVIRSASASGLRTVAVYSEPDRDAPHTRLADEALLIGPAPAEDSYLSVRAVLEAARRSGAGAVHPGYGFLSERADFARAVVDAGLIFIGPPPGVIELMGRKDRARAVALEVGVPVLPVGQQVGFPLLVKAVAGGGGKGMRVVRDPDLLEAAVEAARRESLAAFGDDTLLFERYVEHGRHIEVQILGDEHGNVVHLFERDCSVQRRHQKVLEEAPATFVSGAVREVLLASAVALAGRVGYVGAGTVEFLVTGDDAYFLEMNTRLQVEHPVTEMVTGLDLVALQLTIAQGEPIPFGQSDVSVHGYALEARVYAEDPFHGFVPQAGVAEVVHWPQHARVDAALDPGQRVGTAYDPMLGKVIVSGLTREAARRSLVAALDETAIVGLTTNVGFLRGLADSDAFRAGRIDTGWLDAQPGDTGRPVPEAAWCLAAWSLATARPGASPGPLETPDGWRLAGPSAGATVSLASAAGGRSGAGEAARLLTVFAHEGVVHVDGRTVGVRAVATSGARLCLEVDGKVEVGHVVVARHQVLAAYQGQTYVFERPDAFGPGVRADLHDGSIVAPMPGTVLAVHVTAGSEVNEGDTLAVMEAMKMELALKAPYTGVVASVAATAGDQVVLGARLLTLDPDETAGNGVPVQPKAPAS